MRLVLLPTASDEDPGRHQGWLSRLQLGVYTIRSNLEGGIVIPYLPSESVPSVFNNFIFFSDEKIFSESNLDCSCCSWSPFPLCILCGGREQLVTIPLTMMCRQVGDSNCPPSEPTISAPWTIFPQSHFPPTLQLLLCLLFSPLRMAPQLNSLPALDVSQDEVWALLVHVPLNFPKMGTTRLISNPHSTSGAPPRPSTPRSWLPMHILTTIEDTQTSSDLHFIVS